jgi:hypothetical protein
MQTAKGIVASEVDEIRVYLIRVTERVNDTPGVERI